MTVPRPDDLDEVLCDSGLGLWATGRQRVICGSWGLATVLLGEVGSVPPFLERQDIVGRVTEAMRGEGSVPFRSVVGGKQVLVGMAPRRLGGRVVGTYGALLVVKSGGLCGDDLDRLGDILDTAPLGFFVLDKAGRVVRANVAWREPAVRNAQISDAFPTRNPHANEKESHRPSVSLRTTDDVGRTTHWEGHTFPVGGPTGDDRIVGIFVDTTARVTRERTSEAMQNLFASFAEGSPAASFLLDQEYRLVWCNAAYLASFGRRGGSAAEASRPPSSPALRQGVLDAVQHGASTDVSLTVSSARQVLTQLEGRVFPVAQPDGSRLAGVALTDVTGRGAATAAAKRIERRFDAFMKLLPVAAYAKDEELRYVWLNGAALHMLGKDRQEEVLGLTDLDLDLSPERKRRHFEDSKVLSAGRASSVLVEHGDPPRDRRRSSGMVFPLGGQDGDAVGAFFTDVTEHLHTLDRLQNLRDHFRVVFERSPLPMALLSLGGRITEANIALASLLDSTVTELKSRHLMDFTQLGLRPTEMTHLEQIAAGARTESRLSKRMTRDGRSGVADVSQFLTAVRDTAGAPCSIVAMLSPQWDSTEESVTDVAWKAEDARLLTLVASGASDVQIAQDLGWGESTVRLKLTTMKRRVGARNRAHLAAIACWSGLVRPPV